MFFLWFCWCSQQFWLLPGSQLMFFLSKVDMSFLRLIFFLDVSRCFFLWVCWCSQQFWLLLRSQLIFSVQSRYVLLKAYLLSRCCFSEFAGALSSFGFSYVPSLFFLSKVDMSFLRLIFFLDVVSLNLLVLSPVLASPTFPAYFFCPK